MPLSPHADRRRSVRRLHGWLPVGRPLIEHDASWRHAVVCLVALAHIPVLLAAAVATDVALGPVIALLLALAMLAVATGPFHRRPRALAATGALLVCSLVFVALFPEHLELQAHLLVVVALVALYQDWSVFGLAILFAVLQPALAGMLADQPDPGPNAWGWALVRAGFVVAEAVVLGVFWRADEQARLGEDRLQAALWEGQASVRERLEETERIRTDLIGTVSHEFRTPLTGIRGAALTLLKRGDRLDEAGRQMLLRGMLEQQERLSRLLENMLTAARATAPDPGAVAEVDAVAAEVAMLARAPRPDSPMVSLLVEPGTVARIDRHALHQVLANLVDNAQQHGTPGAVPLIAGGRDGDVVWLAVSNEGGPLDVAATRHLFEPFTQGDATATRAHEGLGMGLYVVRRLVEVYGGWVTVRAEGGWVTVEVRMKAAEGVSRRPASPAASGNAQIARGSARPTAKADGKALSQTEEPTALPTR